MRLEITFGVGFNRFNAEIPANVADKAIRDILNETCRRFGGCTMIATVGAWNSSTGAVVESGRMLIIDGYDTNNGNHWVDKTDLSLFIGQLLNQDSLWHRIDNGPAFAFKVSYDHLDQDTTPGEFDDRR